MRVIGVDPGISKTGFGIIEKSGSNLVHLYNGVIKTYSKYTLPHRLQQIYKELNKEIERFHPDILALESIFYSKNVKSLLVTGYARGVVILCAVNAGLEIFEYSPLRIKQSVVGYGKASKEQVKKMVTRYLLINDELITDASDALGVAICHINSYKMRGNLSDSQY